MSVPRFLQSSTRRYFSGDVWHKFSGANFCCGSVFRVFVGLMGEMLSFSSRLLAATVPRFVAKFAPKIFFRRCLAHIFGCFFLWVCVVVCPLVVLLCMEDLIKNEEC